MAAKLPPAKDWNSRSVQDWNCTSFHCYLSDLHKEKYGIDYQPFRGGWNAEKKLIKETFEQYGKEMTKKLIDISFDTHQVNPQYPTLSFGFIYTYKKSNIIGRLQYEKLQQEKRKQYEEPKMSDEELEDWI